MIQVSINSLLKRLLQLDPEVAAEIYTLAGSVIQINLQNTAAVFTFMIHADGVEFLGEAADNVTVRISGTPAALLAYAAADRNGHNAIPGDLEIAGDVYIVQQLIASLKKLDLDWEEQLAQLSGDTLARKSAQLLRGGATALKNLRHKLELDMGEYLRFEKEAVADEQELTQFSQTVDALRDDVERLKQRLLRLERQGDG
ncbi:MAG: ubiquinone biosynthesis accessory factor UbiJ [Gammaproteobacteria bacterium]